MRSIDLLERFIDEEWNDEFAYVANDIAIILECNPRVARYYLIQMVKKGKIMRIKYRGRTYYIKPYQADWFDEFKEIGLEFW